MLTLHIFPLMIPLHCGRLYSRRKEELVNLAPRERLPHLFPSMPCAIQTPNCPTWCCYPAWQGIIRDGASRAISDGLRKHGFALSDRAEADDDGGTGNCSAVSVGVGFSHRPARITWPPPPQTPSRPGLGPTLSGRMNGQIIGRAANEVTYSFVDQLAKIWDIGLVLVI